MLWLLLALLVVLLSLAVFAVSALSLWRAAKVLTRQVSATGETQTSATAAPAPAEPGPGPDFEPMWRRRVVPDAVLLYQYSAATFNTHRIHYDHPYATGVEGYPGLVVHGPLTATMLMELLGANLPSATPRDFEVTALRPLYTPAPFDLVGRVEGAAFKLLALTADGYPAMRVEGTLA